MGEEYDSYCNKQMCLFLKWRVKMAKQMYGDVIRICLQGKWNQFLLEADETESEVNNWWGKDGRTGMWNGVKDQVVSVLQFKERQGAFQMMNLSFMRY